MIRIYFPDHYKKEFRGELFPLLKAFIKNGSFTDTERITMYGVSVLDYVFVATIQDCDLVILPMSWNYYKRTKQMKLAEDLLQKALSQRKKVFSHMTGDFGVEIPEFSNCIVLRPNGYRSKLPINHIGIPVFISDPMKRYNHIGNSLFEGDLAEPTIGFCGQTNDSFGNAIKEILKVTYRNMGFYFGLNSSAPQQLISSSFLRGHILSIIKKSELLKNQFIERKHYRAGVKTEVERAQSTQEFYENISMAQYTVCVRGAGNFSVRLYETLAMGRIPLFVNTDCLMPLENIIGWKKHVVWIEQQQLKNLPTTVSNFHHKMSTEEHFELLKLNRELWETKLSFPGFFKNLFLSKSLI